MKKLKLLFLVCSSIFIISCKKSGCTNSDAINYNANAFNDDGTCMFEATDYLGGYNVTDIRYNNDSTTIDTMFYEISIAQMDGAEVRINNFYDNGSTVNTKILNSKFEILSPTNTGTLNQYVGNATCTFKIIKWNYSVNNNEFHVSGICEKQ